MFPSEMWKHIWSKPEKMTAQNRVQKLWGLNQSIISFKLQYSWIWKVKSSFSILCPVQPEYDATYFLVFFPLIYIVHLNNVYEREYCSSIPEFHSAGSLCLRAVLNLQMTSLWKFFNMSCMFDRKKDQLNMYKRDSPMPTYK